MEANFDVHIPKGNSNETEAALLPNHSGWEVFAKLRCTLPLLRRKPVDQRQPIKAFPEPSYKIVLPALGTQSAPFPDLLHRHALDQNACTSAAPSAPSSRCDRFNLNTALRWASVIGSRIRPPSTCSLVGSTACGPRSALSQSA